MHSICGQPLHQKYPFIEIVMIWINT